MVGLPVSLAAGMNPPFCKPNLHLAFAEPDVLKDSKTDTYFLQIHSNQNIEKHYFLHSQKNLQFLYTASK